MKNSAHFLIGIGDYLTVAMYSAGCDFYYLGARYVD